VKRIAIIGAGVNGLSTGLELLKAGYEVTIFASETTPNTTSDVAAAIWMPYKVEPKQQAVIWAVISLKRFEELANEVPDAGILFKEHTELYSEYEPKPEWMNYLEALAISADVPQKYQAYSHTVKIPVIDTKKYMPYLHGLFLSRGGKINIATIARIEDLLEEFNIVINCSGIGAKALANDNSVYPIRGQAISIATPNGLDRSMVRPNDGLAHVIPRSNDCLIGGTADENNWNMEYDPEVEAEILARVKEIYPALVEQPITILARLVGLRPGRPTVRLEIQKYDDEHAVVHNYGHGGAGFALSWGCALDSVELVNGFYYKNIEKKKPIKR
jgi:D-amino-acid oxidase